MYTQVKIMKKFYELLKEHTMKIINIKKKNNSMNHMKIQKSILFVKKNLKINI